MGILQQILLLLEQAQLSCAIAFPNRRMPRLEKPTVMLGLSEVQLQPCALCNYLGSDGQTACSAVGYEEKIYLDIYSPYLSGGYQCDIIADKVLQALINGITDFSFSSISRGACYYDPDTDCFRCKISITTQAWLSAAQS